ncbi:MAG: type B 50S ribosomal protein L31 [Opitutaceae bacterium]|nr:type B 50S ribosomal protein L31 [Opitutaceae bacterium]
MKQGIHPEYHPAAFIDVSTGRKFLTRSTIKTGQTDTVDGVDYVKVFRDITMDSHPVYTGEKRFVDTAGRVEKFQNKFRRRRS